jgi:pyrimidine-nucleoside phosphorylase
MNVAEIITQKRDGQSLTDEQIQFLIDGYAKDSIPDYQLSAFAMAVYFQGMTRDETAALTGAMLNSGERMSWPAGKPKVDKHSTGGIGDKVSIPLAPLLACCEVDVPMISGRGLGPTGGTLDKLESITGYRCDLSNDEFRNIVNWHGCSITGASGNLAPADRKLYALRDVTGTVASVPLITASILCKKIAEGISSLVLDVKWGSGSFMKTLEQANELANSLVEVANQFGVKTTALISDMNQPLGRMIGNAVEIDESVDILKGRGPEDVTQLTLKLGVQLLISAGVCNDESSAMSLLKEKIENGDALKKLGEMVKDHGGDLSAPRKRAPKTVVEAYDDGFVCRVDAERLGLAVIEMGGGRKSLGDSIDHSVGIEFLVRIGDEIKKGQPIANLFCQPDQQEYVNNLVALSIGTSPVAAESPELVVGRIG